MILIKGEEAEEIKLLFDSVLGVQNSAFTIKQRIEFLVKAYQMVEVAYRTALLDKKGYRKELAELKELMKTYQFRPVFTIKIIGDPKPQQPTGDYVWYHFDGKIESAVNYRSLEAAIAGAKLHKATNALNESGVAIDPPNTV